MGKKWFSLDRSSGCRIPLKKEQEFGIRAPGGGGTPLYKAYRYVPPHRVGFLLRFGQKTGLHFAHFGLELGMVSE